MKYKILQIQDQKKKKEPNITIYNEYAQDKSNDMW